MAEPVALKPGEVLIGYGQFDTNVYIVKEGILQLLYFDGEKEVSSVLPFQVQFCSLRTRSIWENLL